MALAWPGKNCFLTATGTGTGSMTNVATRRTSNAKGPPRQKCSFRNLHYERPVSRAPAKPPPERLSAPLPVICAPSCSPTRSGVAFRTDRRRRPGVIVTALICEPLGIDGPSWTGLHFRCRQGHISVRRSRQLIASARLHYEWYNDRVSPAAASARTRRTAEHDLELLPPSSWCVHNGDAVSPVIIHERRAATRLLT